MTAVAPFVPRFGRYAPGSGRASRLQIRYAPTRSGEKRWVNVSNLTVNSEGGLYLVHLIRDSQGMHDVLEVARGLTQLSSKDDAPALEDKGAPALTARQVEILRVFSEGKSARENGQELYLSQAAVRNHISSLLQAFEAHSQLETLAKARGMGLLTG